MPNLLTVDDLSVLLKLTKRQVAERVTKRSDFPKPYQIGGALRWAEDEILQWLEDRKL